MKTWTRAKEILETLILLVMFLGTILSSCWTITASVLVHDMRLESLYLSRKVVDQYQNVTYEGDLVISGNETFTIENSEFYMNGTITVRDTATLNIVDSKFTTIPSLGTDGDSIVLTNRANLIVKSTTVIFKRPGGFASEIVVRDDARANITHSTLRNRGYVTAHNNSVIHVDNSTITRGTTITTYEPSGVATSDASTGLIENSTTDGVFVWDKSTVSVKNSNVGIIRTGWENPDKTTINIENSKIDYIEVFGGAPAFNIKGSTVTDAGFNVGAFAWFTSSSVSKMFAHDNATIWLIDSSYGSIETRDGATVFVGWHLPLFGLIIMPNTWIPIIQLIIVMMMGVTIVTIFVVLRRKSASCM